MAGVSREEILTRYRHLRALATQHHSDALKFLSRSAILEQARHLGLTRGKMLVAESLDEMTLAFDLAIHTARPGHSRAIDRYARAAQLPPGSERVRNWHDALGAAVAGEDRLIFAYGATIRAAGRWEHEAWAGRCIP